jgi:hypothetical protein
MSSENKYFYPLDIIENYITQERKFGDKYLSEIKKIIRDNNLKINILNAKLHSLSYQKHSSEKITKIIMEIATLENENSILTELITCKCDELLQPFLPLKKRGIPKMIYEKYLTDMDKNFKDKCIANIQTLTRCLYEENFKVVKLAKKKSIKRRIPTTIKEEDSKQYRRKR